MANTSSSFESPPEQPAAEDLPKTVLETWLDGLPTFTQEDAKAARQIESVGSGRIAPEQLKERSLLRDKKDSSLIKENLSKFLPELLADDYSISESEKLAYLPKTQDTVGLERQLREAIKNGNIVVIYAALAAKRQQYQREIAHAEERAEAVNGQPEGLTEEGWARISSETVKTLGALRLKSLASRVTGQALSLKFGIHDFDLDSRYPTWDSVLSAQTVSYSEPNSPDTKSV